MEVPTGFLATFWSFISFLPFFFILLILGLIKAAIIGPIVVLIVFIGSSAVIIGLWPVHLMWTYYCVLKTKIFGLALKVLLLLFLPVPLLAWPIVGILGSLLVGVGYGFVSPLVATFEAVGEQVMDKLFHCFSDGCRSSLEGACTIVQDLTDFCFHSYFSYMDELMQEVPEYEKPWDIKLSKLPSCLLVCLLAVPIDMIMITLVALWKSPCMLIRGWQRLLQDLIGREGPFLETVCVPFAGLAIILWPIAVVGAVVCAFICSCFLALYGGVVVYQENSLRMGLSYIVSVISMFDEYTNDLLYLREGSCLPRPEYRKDKAQDVTERKKHNEQDKNEFKDATLGATSTKLASERSRTLKKVFQQLKPIQIWDWLFRSCEQNGRNLLRDGLITVIDIADCILKGKCKKLSIKLPAWCILQCLLRSAKSDSYGLLISDEVELTKFNWPKDKVLEWLLGPLLVMKEQIKGLHLDENEEACLRKLIMTYICESPEDWSGSGFPLNDRVRIAQLQAICRRLQGIVGSMSRIPTFRRRFRNLIKELYMEAVKTGALNQDGDSSISISKISKSIDSDGKREMDAVEITVENGADDNLDIV